jgi:hypothetical protein
MELLIYAGIAVIVIVGIFSSNKSGGKSGGRCPNINSKGYCSYSYYSCECNKAKWKSDREDGNVGENS